MERSIKAEALKSQLAQPNENLVILDIRRKIDYDADQIRIPDATWYDPEEVEKWSATLPKEQEIIVYCARGGSVSNAVIDKLHDKAIPARFIEGGIEAWKAAGGKTEYKEE